MTTYWTITYNGLEQTFAAQGIAMAGCQRTLANMAPDEFSFTLPGPCDQAEPFVYRSLITIQRDRTLTAGVFSGGSIYFLGRVAQTKRSGSGQSESLTITLRGPWWDLQQIVFQQAWQQQDGGPGHLITTYNSEIWLGINSALGIPQTSDEDLAAVIAWAAGCGIAIQAGELQASVQLPIYNARDITCAEVIIQILRWLPNTVCAFDYTTTPPTLNILSLPNLPVVNLPGSVAPLRGIALTPRHDLVLPAVCLTYKQTAVLNGTPLVALTPDYYPPGANPKQVAAFCACIELYGASQTNVYSPIEVVPFAAQAGDNADIVAWWKLHDPLFDSACIDPSTLTITAATVSDDALNVLDVSATPNELTKGVIHPWMTDASGNPINGQVAVVKALAAFDLYSDSTLKIPLQKGRTKELSVKVKLTNGVTQTYSAIKSLTYAEALPVGLAQSIYEAHAVLQYDGEITLSAAEVPHGVAIACSLTLSTGAATYSGLLVQQITEDLGSGRMTIRTGPARHLGLADLINLWRVNRYRLTINNPSTQGTGVDGNTVSVGIGKETHRENTTTGNGAAQTHTAIAPATTNPGDQTIVQKNAASQALVIQVVDETGLPVVQDSDGNPVGSIILGLAATQGQDIYLRQISMCVQGTRMAAIAAISETFAPPS